MFVSASLPKIYHLMKQIGDFDMEKSFLLDTIYHLKTVTNELN